MYIYNGNAYCNMCGVKLRDALKAKWFEEGGNKKRPPLPEYQLNKPGICKECGELIKGGIW